MSPGNGRPVKGTGTGTGKRKRRKPYGKGYIWKRAPGSYWLQD